MKNNSLDFFFIHAQIFFYFLNGQLSFRIEVETFFFLDLAILHYMAFTPKLYCWIQYKEKHDNS